MGRKKENTPRNIKRYTVQLDEEVYSAVKRAAIGRKKKNNIDEDVKTYELINKVILLGIADWSKQQKHNDDKINLKDPKFIQAKNLAKQVP